MFKTRILFPALFLITAVPTVSSAQLYTTTYQVQVQYEFWRSGSTSWSTVFETDDQNDAEFMYDVLMSAYENGVICDVLDCGFDWIVVDVRLVAKTSRNFQLDARQVSWSENEFINLNLFSTSK